ncbi:MAG: TlyA family RNA methyltransferase [Clostridia bacterium]|nr:TlyA family RNA methyltransferase [Clostridia bacterium]
MRADLYLHAAGYTASRKKAQDLIDAGAVMIDGAVVKKSSSAVDETVPHQVEIQPIFKYVSRGGMKLEAALDAFRINVNRKRAVDVGASTGGFTDCLLKRGAAQVVSIDSGIGQLHESLLADPRVISVERFNARELDETVTGGPCDLAVCDVSFISQTYLIPNIVSVLKPGGEFVSLIKPQFEAGRSALGKGGVVHSGAYRYLAVKRVLECGREHGLDCVGLIRSPIEGGDGNKEYLAYFIKRACLVPRIDDKALRHLTAL